MESSSCAATTMTRAKGRLLLAGLFTILLAGCATQPGPNLGTAPENIHPYLQLAGPNCEPTLIWSTALPEPSRVWWGRPASTLNHKIESPDPVRHHVLTLTGLRPDTEYEYQVQGRQAVSRRGTFRTLPQPRPDGSSAPFTALIYGDNRSDVAAHTRIIDRMVRTCVPSLVVSTGDLVYSGVDSLRWYREFLKPGNPLFSRAPVMISVGNHDVDRTSDPPYSLSCWWLKNFAFPGAVTDPGYGRWFSYQAGGIHFIHLDSNVPGDTHQLAWLLRDLNSPAAVQADFRVVIYHHPDYSAGGHNSKLKVRNLWEGLLKAGGVDLIFNGHNHFYQRTFPVLAGQVAAAMEKTTDGLDLIQGDGPGMVHVVAGGGGAPLYDPEDADFVAVSAKQFHFIRLDYQRGVLHCTAINEAGETIDEFVVRGRSFNPAGD